LWNFIGWFLTIKILHYTVLVKAKYNYLKLYLDELMKSDTSSISNFALELKTLEEEVRTIRQSLETYGRKIMTKERMGNLSEESNAQFQKIDSITKELVDLFNEAKLLDQSQTSNLAILNGIPIKINNLKVALDDSKNIK
jgi:hypothetical protein